MTESGPFVQEEINNFAALWEIEFLGQIFRNFTRAHGKKDKIFQLVNIKLTSMGSKIFIPLKKWLKMWPVWLIFGGPGDFSELWKWKRASLRIGGCQGDFYPVAMSPTTQRQKSINAFFTKVTPWSLKVTKTVIQS